MNNNIFNCVVTIDEIISLCVECIERKPTYGDTEEDILKLNAKKELAIEILNIIEDV